MKKNYILICLAALVAVSCNYLDVVPDNIATLDMAFNTRANAEKYLATCYHYLPIMGHWGQNSGLVRTLLPSRSPVACRMPTTPISIIGVDRQTLTVCGAPFTNAISSWPI